jgi:hypothetical protein
LRVDLVDIGKSFRQDIAGHLVSIFVFELGRLPASTVNAMEPVITQPTEEEILKMCETDEGSISLS